VFGGTRLPGEASPEEVGKGQHNDDDDDDPEPNRHVILSLGSMRTLRRADPYLQECPAYAPSGAFLARASVN
jgi:hypothetical protein